jgi:hypothetical protein
MLESWKSQKNCPADRWNRLNYKPFRAALFPAFSQ